MTDVNALKNAINEQGMTISSLARIIGMNKQTLFNRMDDPDFRVSEIEAISEALHLSDIDRNKIFFAIKGD